LLGLLLVPLVTACASVPLEPAGSLSSYQRLTPSNGLLTHAQVSVSQDDILAARTVHIIPTFVSPRRPADPKILEAQRRLIANAVDRSLCTGLGDRFQIVPPGQAADLTVHAFITRIVPTDEIAAAASRPRRRSLDCERVGAITAPVPSVRVPIGLGGLALERKRSIKAAARKPP